MGKPFAFMVAAAAVMALAVSAANAEHSKKTQDMWGKLGSESKLLVKEMMDRYDDLCDQPQNGRAGYMKRVSGEMRKRGDITAGLQEVNQPAGKYVAVECKTRKK